MNATGTDTQTGTYSADEIGALAHFYRGEMYRSTVWRTRLDTTTNWAIVTTGIALSVTFSSIQATPVPIVLVSFLLAAFLLQPNLALRRNLHRQRLERSAGR